MPTFTKTEKNAFATLGEAICSAKESAKDKKDTLPLVKAAIAENREAFMEGVTIGNYKFTLVVREELTAIRV